MVTSPIRTKEEIEKMKEYYLTKKEYRASNQRSFESEMAGCI